MKPSPSPLLILLLPLLCSCAPARNATRTCTKGSDPFVLVQPSRDTLIQHRHQHDSVFVLYENTTHQGQTLMRSSPEQIRVDTVILKHTEYRLRTLRDTVRVSHTDTVPVVRVQEVVREVPSPIPRSIRLLAWIGALALALLIFRLVYKLRARLYK